LKQKQDNGADYIMTQLCWDMDQFRYWLDAIRAAGIWMPVDVGIMPILDQAAFFHTLFPFKRKTQNAKRRTVLIRRRGQHIRFALCILNFAL